MFGFADPVTFWKEHKKTAEYFFRICLLPEVLGNWYTQDNICSFIATDSELPSSDQPSNSNTSNSSTNTSSYTAVDEHTFCFPTFVNKNCESYGDRAKFL